MTQRNFPPIAIIKICCLVFVLALVLTALPVQAGFIPQGYSSFEYYRLVDFLETYAGQSKNGDYLTFYNYDVEDPQTWTGIVWTEIAGIKRVKSISINNHNIRGYLDVSDFSVLETLAVNSSISGLNADGCSSLQSLTCCSQELEELSMEGCGLLNFLECSNGLISELDLSLYENLEELICHSGSITSLDLSNNSNLRKLDCSFQEHLIDLNLDNTNLEELFISNCPNLQVDFSALANLKYLDCNRMDARNFDFNLLSKLESLNCSECSLTNLDLSGTPNLIELDCSYNDLTNLDLSGLHSLEYLSCEGCFLTALDLSGAAELLVLACDYNLLSELDLSACSKLEDLSCSYNNLNKLDLRPCNQSTELNLHCPGNYLTELKFNNNINQVYCADNYLAFSDLFALSEVAGYLSYKPQRNYRLGDNNIIPSGQVFDLSEEAIFDGQETVFSWYDEGESGISPQVGDRPGEFIFDSSFNDSFVYCVMTNEAFSGLTLQSNLAKVVAGVARPAIVSQPQDVTIDEYETAQFSLAVNGPAGYEFGYQWEISRDGGASWQTIEGAEKAIYETSWKTMDNSGEKYRCHVSVLKNSSSFLAYSQVATLTVQKPLRITQQPRDAGYLEGGSAKLNIIAEGRLAGSTLSYQWERRPDGGSQPWEEVPGGKAAELIVSNCSSADDQRNYRCIVTETKGVYKDEIVSQAARTIWVTPPLASTNGNPQPIRKGEGKSGAFAALFGSNSGTQRHYSWQISTDDGVNWTTIEGENSYVYTIPYVDRDMTADLYRCVVRASCGEVFSEPTYSESVDIRIYCHYPAIVTQPENKFTTDGNVVFSLEVDKDELDREHAVSRESEWQFSVDGGINWQSIEGTDNTVLSIGSRTYEEHHKSLYRYATKSLRAGYESAYVYSNPALLLVMRKPIIINQPAWQNLIEGQEAVFSVDVDPNGDYQQVYSWQWQKGSDPWTTIEDSNSQTLKFIAGPQDDLKSYRCMVKNVYDYGESEEAVSNAARLYVVAKPQITTQPFGVDLLEGESTTFMVEASADGTISYKWQEKEGDEWKDLAGENSSVLAINDVSYDNNNGKRYRCLVSNTKDRLTASTISDEALLTVVPQAVIVEQPQDLIAGKDEDAVFKVSINEAKGSVTSYKWFESTDGTNWVQLLDADGPECVIEDVQYSQSGNRYKCVIQHSKGLLITPAVESDPALLQVLARPTITLQPEDQTVLAGVDVNFTVAGTIKDGLPGDQLTYQWQMSSDQGENWLDLTAANGTAITIEDVNYQDHNGKLYRCVLTNTSGSLEISAESHEALLTVVGKPVILSQPADVGAGEGSSALFQVVVEAVPGAQQTFEWQVSADGGASWQNVGGDWEEELTLSTLTLADHGKQYKCSITNRLGGKTFGPTESDVASLTVLALPEITSQPKSVMATVGDDVHFALQAKIADADSGGKLSYQWQVSEDSGGNWQSISGADQAEYTFFNVQNEDENKIFRCLLMNTKNGFTIEPVISAEASLIMGTNYLITFVRPTVGHDEHNPLNINSGSLVIANILGNLSAIERLTIQIDSKEEIELSPAATVYYLMGTNLSPGEHTITLKLVNESEVEFKASVSFFWEQYRRGFGFGRFDFE